MKVEQAKFNSSSGLLSTLLYSNAFPNLEIVHLNYVIYLESAPFTFCSYSPEAADYHFAGVVNFNANVNVSIETSAISFVSRLLNCQGAGCLDTCIG